MIRAGLITGTQTLELREFPDPVPVEGGVVVDIAYCGICGTDVHAFQSGQPYNPAICGHEWTGTLSAIGPGVRSLSEGQRVVVATAPACGACVACRAGQAERCQTAFLSAIGRDAASPPHGGFAPRLAVAATKVVPTDPGLTDLQAAQVEPFTVAFHAVRSSRLRLGDTAVVQGAGPIGLATLQWVRAAGAGRVIVVEPNSGRAALAASLGASEVVGPGAAASDLIAERTRGLGADIVYECVGRPSAIQAAVDLTRRGGSVCLIGLADGDATISPHTWLIKEIVFTTALAYFHEEFVMAMGMIADGRIVTEPLHTGTVGLDALGGVLAELAGGATDHVKVLVDPHLRS
ncbi:zinc-dependent alcohol dehydrogenase [Desertimonas flava]|jgi:(R,R)-butanediol dehydrogenase/meso-butanediol dehydrogenase/diacetyl reductase|uniref:zinc-dependent alcohol dehydrogenase n=1 Tax=Desertimonas flava TaxID=2064846 RepID=UPI000E348DD2|nr:zinc-binding dehydrogenase [Desertimonas flava]